MAADFPVTGTPPPGSYRIASQSAALFAAAVGVAVLVGGWVLRIDILRGAVPGYVGLKPNTALALILGGCALWNSCRTSRRTLAVSRVCSILLLLIGVSTQAEYLFDVDLGIDQLLFYDFTPERAHL